MNQIAFVAACVFLLIAARVSLGGGEGVGRGGGQSGRTPNESGTGGGSNRAAAQLHQLFDERFKWLMEQFPQEAMSKGDYSHADRLADTSLAAIEQRHQVTVEHLKRLQSIDKQSLAENDRINFDLFELELRNAVDGHQFRDFLVVIRGRSGPQQRIPQMADRVRFDSVEDYQNYLKRLEQVPKLVNDTIEVLRAGAKEKRTPPQVALLGVPSQFAALLNGQGLRALAAPFANVPPAIDQQQIEPLRLHFEKISLPSVLSSVAKLAAFFDKEYLLACRQSIAAIDWPDGEKYYNFQLRLMTTTDLTAPQIHQLGLREVKRIKAEMMGVIYQSDFLSLHPEAATPVDAIHDTALFKAFINYLRTDARFYHKTERDLITGYRDICKQVDAELPRFFKTLPRLPYGVKEIPAFMAPNHYTAHYQSGDIRNAQPGYFMANTYDLRQRPKYEMIPLAMHEAVPGHHLQVAIAQEIEGLPEFRQDLWFTAFGEGWALYSERLGLEMDLYKDPYDNFGRLLYEMWRACRLVVDPGMHALGWSRQQAIQFMLDNTALSELNITNEIDRYIEWPGQAVGYKIGELKIRELRAKAEKELGEKEGGFDIREFHDVVLGAGNIPLSVLERRVNEWIKARGR